MNSLYNKYHGEKIQSSKTENFHISITQHDANSHIKTHAHETPYLCFLISGSYYEQNNIKKLVESGSVLFRGSNFEHENVFLGNNSICFNLEFNNNDSLNLLSECKFPVFKPEKPASTSISKLVISFLKGSPNDVLDIQCHESIHAHFENFQTSGKLKWVNDVIEFINDDPHQTISLDVLSKQFQLHPNYIVRKFKEITNYRLSEYLEKIRLESSLLQLIKSKDKVCDIALDTGFYDQSHLNRSFKKHLKMTPNNFRKQLLKNLVKS